MRTLLPFAALLLALPVFGPPLPAAGQSVTVDEGTFLISVQGQRVGTETFMIRRSGSGEDAQIIATAEIQMELPEGHTDLRPSLHAMGRDMAVFAYQIKVSGGSQEEISVTEGDRRYITRVRSERGEREREFRAAPGTLLLDTNVAHQFYFLASRMAANGAAIPVISPREGRQYDLRASEVGSETVQIAGQSISARHLRLEGEGGVRDIWIDGEGRVLRVDHPERGYSAVRDAAP